MRIHMRGLGKLHNFPVHVEVNKVVISRVALSEMLSKHHPRWRP
jgi:hypothetical protein